MREIGRPSLWDDVRLAVQITARSPVSLALQHPLQIIRAHRPAKTTRPSVTPDRHQIDSQHRKASTTEQSNRSTWLLLAKATDSNRATRYRRSMLRPRADRLLQSVSMDGSIAFRAMARRPTLRPTLWLALSRPQWSMELSPAQAA